MKSDASRPNPADDGLPYVWAPPGTVERPRPGMRVHRQRPETRARITRMARRRTARSAAVVVAGGIVAVGAGGLVGGADAFLGLACLFAVVAAVTTPLVAIQHRRSVAWAIDLVLLVDDDGLVLRRPGSPDYEVRRSDVTEVTGDAQRVVLHSGDRALLVLDDGLDDWEGLMSVLDGWHTSPG